MTDTRAPLTAQEIGAAKKWLADMVRWGGAECLNCGGDSEQAETSLRALDELEALREAKEPKPAGYVLLEFENRNLWHIRASYTGKFVWSRDEAESEARSLACDGYRVRIVPLLRGTPVEIRGDV